MANTEIITQWSEEKNYFTLYVKTKSGKTKVATNVYDAVLTNGSTIYFVKENSLFKCTAKDPGTFEKIADLGSDELPFQNFADYRDGKIYYTCYNPEERNHGYLYSVSLKNGSVTELAGDVDYAYRWYGLFYLNHVQYEEDDLQYLSIFDERTGETNLVSDQILDYVDDQNYIYYAKVVDGSHPATVEMWRYETATGEQKQLTDAFLCYGLESLDTKHIVYFTDNECETTASKKW